MDRKNKMALWAVVLGLCGQVACSQQKIAVDVQPDESKNRVDVKMGGELFTAYIFPNEIKKPVLWPIVSPGGNELTRNFPLKNKAGERVDHPHHVGVWFNYGDVNGLDFWNNSEAIAVDKRDKYGTIRHKEILKAEGGQGKGVLVTTSEWQDSNGNILLEEKTRFTFTAKDNVRIIDRESTLKAVNGPVTFTDNKEGMFAIRVTRELELPVNKALELSDSHGKVTKVASPDNSNVTGDYLSSEGVTGEKVWGTRADWMKLSGTINGEKTAIVIYDHKDNVGYPTYWHARTYGLFAANTLGQKIFSDGEKELNFSLKQGESTTFRYRLAVFSGDPSVETVKQLAADR